MVGGLNFSPQAAGPAPRGNRAASPMVPDLVSFLLSAVIELMPLPQILPGQPTPKKPKGNPEDPARRQEILEWLRLRHLAVARLGQNDCKLPW